MPDPLTEAAKRPEGLLGLLAAGLQAAKRRQRLRLRGPDLDRQRNGSAPDAKRPRQREEQADYDQHEGQDQHRLPDQGGQAARVRRQCGPLLEGHADRGQGDHLVIGAEAHDDDALRLPADL